MDDQKRVAAARRESEALSRRIMESSFDCIQILDREGRLLSMSPGGQRLLEIPDLTPALNRSWLEFWEGADREAARAAVAAAWEGGVGAFQGFCPTVTGKPKWWDVVLTPIRDSQGQPERLLAIARDVTEHQRLETELRQRAAALAETDRRKDEFLAMLGHELRNPLSTLSNALHLLKQRGEDPALERPRALMERQVKQLTRLTDDLMDISRIGSGKISLCRERLDLAPLVRDAAEDYRAMLEEVDLTLSLQLPETPVWVEGDPARLAQVVGNLLQNAAKYTDPGGTVTVGCQGSGKDEDEQEQEQEQEHEHEHEHEDEHEEEHEHEDEHEQEHEPTPDTPHPTPSAAITVRDTGIGIAPEMLPRVFEPFAQVEGNEGRGGGGLGLGLALVKALVELHGGRVAVRSAGPGQGAEFTVLLPLAADDPSAPQPSPPLS